MKLRFPLITTLLILMPFTSRGQLNPYEGATVYGCIEYNDSVFIKQTEVSIAEWMAFLFTLYETEYEKHESADLTKFLPDTVLPEDQFVYDIFLRNWEDVEVSKPIWYKGPLNAFPLFLEKEEKKEFKSRIQHFLDKPVTGVSEMQIRSFIGWKQDQLNEMYENDNYTYEAELLPAVRFQELVDSTLAGYRKSFDKSGRALAVGDSVNVKGCYLFNCKGSSNCQSSEQRHKIYGKKEGLVSGYSYLPNINGYYNILGNAAEIVQGKEALGGHFGQTAKQILKGEAIPFTEPDPKIGFRYQIILKAY